MATEVGKGTVPIEADVSNLSKDLDSKMKGQSGEITRVFGGMGKFAGAALVGAIGLAVAGFAGLAKLGESFDSAFDTIRIQTGKTGAELTGLQNDFKAVVSTVPASFGDAGNAVAALNQKLGLSGKPLQQISEQMLNLSRITKTDLKANVDAAAGTFNQWGITVDQQSPKLDELFRISQQTGVSFDTLATAMSQGGAQFRAAGLTFEQSGALIGLLAKNGLDAGAVIPALSKAMATAAKEGKPAADVFRETFDAIKNAPDDTAGAQAAIEVFGTKAGPKFAALIREGKLGYEDFATTIAAGGDTINEAAKATDDWREKLKLLMNKAFVALQPLANKVFGAITRLVELASGAFRDLVSGFKRGTDDIGSSQSKWAVAGAVLYTAFLKVKKWFVANWPAIKRVALEVFDAIKTAILYFVETIVPTFVKGARAAFGWLMDNKEVLVGIGIGVAAAFVAWAAAAVAAAAPTIAATAPIIAIGLAVAGLAAGVLYCWDHFKLFRDIVTEVASILKDIFDVALTIVTTTIGILISAIQWAWTNVLSPLASFLVDVFTVSWAALQLLWDNVVRPSIDALTIAFQWLWDHVLSPIASFLSGVFRGAWDIAKTGFDIALTAWNAMMLAFQWLYDHVLSPIGTFIAGAWAAAWAASATLWTNVVQPAWDQMTSDIQKVWQGILVPLAGWLGTGWNAGWSLGRQAVGLMGDALGVVRDIGLWTYENVVQPITAFMMTGWYAGWTVAKIVIDLAVSSLETLGQIISSVWNTWLSPVASFISTVFVNAWDDATGAISKVIGWISSLLGFVDKLYSKLSSVLGPLGDLMSIGGGGFGFGIPGFANGALVTKPTLSVVGDAPLGEAVINRPQMRQILAWAGANSAPNNVGQPNWQDMFPDNVTLVIEGMPVTAIVQKSNNQLASALTAGARR